MLALVKPAGTEDLSLAISLGRTLAMDVVAGRDQPPFAASAMDGWAVRSDDGPGRLRIVGESAAGRGFSGNLGPGEAVRIFTGAPVPPGADAVVIQEEARRDGTMVVIPSVQDPRHIRPAGQDFIVGTKLLSCGERLDPWGMSLAAAAGLDHVRVSRRPRVVILSTGEEVVEPGATPGPFQIFNSGTTALCALVTLWGGDPVALRPVGDNIAATAGALADVACDLVVTLGGASVGDYDLVKPALGTLGLKMVVESVAVRPGKPTWFGSLGDGRPVLGLPGNPASAMVCAELFLKPWLRAALGTDPALPMLWARTLEAMPAAGPREHWMRAQLTSRDDASLGVRAYRDQDSSLVSVFAGANALLCRPAGAQAVKAGTPVEVLRLDRLV